MLCGTSLRLPLAPNGSGGSEGIVRGQSDEAGDSGVVCGPVLREPNCGCECSGDRGAQCGLESSIDGRAGERARLAAGVDDEAGGTERVDLSWIRSTSCFCRLTPFFPLCSFTRRILKPRLTSEWTSSVEGCKPPNFLLSAKTVNGLV